MKILPNNIYLGNCLELMKFIPDQSIDFICCDLPFGLTKNKWDSVIPLDLLWEQYLRIIKPNGPIILFGQDKFSAKLMLSQEKLHRYNIIYEKTTPTGHLNANRMPLRSHEDIMIFNTDVEAIIEHGDILIFYKKLPTYNPQKTFGHERKVSTAEHKRNSKKTENYGEHGLTGYDSTERHPKSVWRFSTDKQTSAIHPTQKSLKLIEQLVKTYSNENDLGLDNCSGSGTFAEACINTNRNYICMEQEQKYFDLSIERINTVLKNKINQ